MIEKESVMVDPTAVLLTRDANECGPRISSHPVPYWPNTWKDNEYWKQAKVELGPSASVSELALRAQAIKIRANMPAEDDMERLRRKKHCL
jgi:hypothetical protein